MENFKKNVDFRRYINWSRLVKGKPIHIRLYELIYFELLLKWIEMNKPSLRRLIYETWCLKKKAKQIEDITKKERFDVTADLPLAIN